jgi:Flp pilus assembly protein TadG
VASERPRGTLAWIRRCRDESGNTLVLFPAAVLILLGLGAIALDSATLFLGQRRLSDLAASVANDAIAGVDLDAFYDESTDTATLAQQRGDARAQQLTSSQSQDRAFEAVSCSVQVADGVAEATATCTGQVRPILAPFWGADATRSLEATETAIGVEN